VNERTSITIALRLLPFLMARFSLVLGTLSRLRSNGVTTPPPAGQVGKVAVARMAPVVVTRRAPVSGPLVAGSGLPQYP
jgi:hypothetical protein